MSIGRRKEHKMAEKEDDKRTTLKLLNRFTGDPVCVDDNRLYWFYNEIWTDLEGPFDSLQNADRALDLYVKNVIG